MKKKTLKMGDKMKVVHTEVEMTGDELDELLSKHTIDIAPKSEDVPPPVVEVTIGPADEVWVNVDGVCRFRAKRCTVIFEDNRPGNRPEGFAPSDEDEDLSNPER